MRVKNGDQPLMCPGNKKLVVLGIPWEVDTEGLRQYMSQFGELADVMVMKDHSSGCSRGFGYATFSSLAGVQKALAAKHIMRGRLLEVKVATPKEEMGPVSKIGARIFVARIPSSVTDEDFHSYFLKYGPIVDAYMPKEPVTKQHRGIGFVTYENTDSVDQLMSKTHELGNSVIAVDRATPKENSKSLKFGSHYLTPHSRLSKSHSAAVSSDDPCGGIANSSPQHNKQLSSNVCLAQVLPSIGHVVDLNGANIAGGAARVENKLFIGRIPAETTSEDLQAYFSQFGRVLDAYLPKDARRTSHRGFGFVTFADEASAARVTRLRHYIHGREIAVDSAAPQDHAHGYGLLASNAKLIPEGELRLHSRVPDATPDNSGPNGLAVKCGKRLFIGRIPVGATAVDLRVHFSQFGRVLDVYLPKDVKKTSHRGFGFVTFADDISAEYAFQKDHRILGQKIVLDHAAPLENEVRNTDNISAVDTGDNLFDEAVAALQELSRQKMIPPRNVSARLTSRFKPY